MNYWYCALVFLVALSIGGCKARPDLIPVSLDTKLGPLGYCQHDSFNQFTVTVKNQGNAAAPVSKVTVEFLPGGKFVQQVYGPGPEGALPPGTAWDIIFQNSPPPSCFNPDCEFKITVDSEGQINESNEANNVVDGRCIG